jgi:acetylornithine/succinyldiaminopimelate/putrescine aminotransferase
MPSPRQLFLQHLAQTSPSPLMLDVERAEGVYLYDANGKAYLDLISGIGVSSLGHRHPRVVEAVKKQVDRYMHTMVYGEYILDPQVQLAGKLAEVLPERLDNVYFVNSGAEATEGAMKLAKRYTGRSEIISCYNAYHGSTQGAASLMSEPYFTRPYRPLLPGIRHFDFNCHYCLNRITEKTAAVIVETIQAEWGVRPPQPGYLEALRRRCNEVGALLILDEIQVGYGRTGTLFAFEQFGIEPDILLLAKGMGGGMPIGAFVSRKEYMQSLSDDPILGHITTFGGHPVSCAAALATLETLLEGELVKQVKAKEKHFRERLVHPQIRDVRSAGLIMAVELDDFDQIQRVIRGCLDKGLITDWFLFNNRSLRIAPPLVISDSEIDWACDVILESIERNKKRSQVVCG